MYLKVAFKTGNSLHRSDGLRETVPDPRTSNRIAWSPNLVLVCGTMKSRLLAERRPGLAGSLVRLLLAEDIV